MEYRALQRHIDDVVKTELEEIPSDVKVPTPEISYKDKETTISFKTPNFFPNNYQDLLVNIGEHYARIDHLKQSL